MDSSTLFVIVLISAAIWCFLLIIIIEKGSRSKEVEQQLKKQSALISEMIEQIGMQTLLLSNIAAKNGVDDGTIKRILKSEQNS